VSHLIEWTAALRNDQVRIAITVEIADSNVHSGSTRDGIRGWRSVRSVFVRELYSETAVFYGVHKVFASITIQVSVIQARATNISTLLENWRTLGHGCCANCEKKY